MSPATIYLVVYFAGILMLTVGLLVALTQHLQIPWGLLSQALPLLIALLTLLQRMLAAHLAEGNAAPNEIHVDTSPDHLTVTLKGTDKVGTDVAGPVASGKG